MTCSMWNVTTNGKHCDAVQLCQQTLTKYIAENNAEIIRTAGRKAKKKDPPNLASCVNLGMSPCTHVHSLAQQGWQLQLYHACKEQLL